MRIHIPNLSHSLLAAIGLAVGTTLITQSPSSAQTCAPLPVVGGQGTEVDKAVSPPSIGVFRNNWDTDFSTGDVSASRYTALIEAEDPGEYSVEMYLKYPDGNADEIFNDGVELSAGERFNISGTRRLGDRPYQINLSVGGLSAVGNSYSASVSGC